MNPYLETLKDELREDCGEDICQADWDCFWCALKEIDDRSFDCAVEVRLMAKDDQESMIDDDADYLAGFAIGTRAHLPSIVKYAYAAIEENLK